MLYYLDEKLIGVEALDITKTTMESCYFFYNTDYDFLNLGVVSANMSI